MTDLQNSVWQQVRKEEFPMNIRPGLSLCLLGCILIISFIITGVFAYFIARATSDNPAAGLRISTILQDLLIFIVPAIATAMISTRYPAQLLCLMQRPRLIAILLVAAVLIISIPAQEAIIYWNYHWDWLPQNIEHILRTMEDNAADTMAILLLNDSIGALIANILIIGVAAGFSEELLFRGALLRLMLRLTQGTRINVHVCVWLVAFIFSFMHFQFFGFVPRLLLGVYFGYLLLWSRSIWLPISAHILNNTVYVCAAWIQVRSNGVENLNTEPTLYSYPLIILSTLCTAVLLYALWRIHSKQTATQD